MHKLVIYDNIAFILLRKVVNILMKNTCTRMNRNGMSGGAIKYICFILSVIFLLSGLPNMVLASGTSEPDYFSVDDSSNFIVNTSITSSWDSHANIDLTFANTGTETIHNWNFTFDLPYTIENIWNASVVETDGNGVYTINNATWNQDINPGASITIGMTVASPDGTKVEMMPNYYLLNSCRQECSISDYSVNYTEYSNWVSGFNGALIISNKSQNEIKDWEVAFSSNRTITEVAQALLNANENGSYVITNDGYNQNLSVGANYNITINGTEKSTDAQFSLENIVLTKVDLAYGLSQDIDEDGIADYKEFMYPEQVVEPTVTPTPSGEPTPIPTDVPNGDIEIELSVDKNEIIKKDAVECVFFKCSTDIIASQINVVDRDGNIVATLMDNGNYGSNGDDIAGDGVFSGLYWIDLRNVGEFKFSVSEAYQNETYTAETTINIYEAYTETNNSELKSVFERIRTVKYSDEYSSLSNQDRIDWLLAELNEIVENGTDTYSYNLIKADSLRYDSFCNCVFFTMYFGCEAMIQVDLPNYELADTGGSSSARTHVEGDYEGDVLILFDYYDHYDSNAPDDVDGGYEAIKEEIEEEGYSVAIDYNFTVGDLRTIMENREMIVFACHGSTDTTQRSFIYNDEDINITTTATTLDLTEGRLVPTDSGYCVTPEFFDKYCAGKLNDTIIFLGSCYAFGEDGNTNTSLGATFETCGAAATIGCINSVYVRYPMDLFEEFSLEILDHNTVEETYNYALSEVGENDAVWYQNNGNTVSDKKAEHPGTPQLYGNKEYSIPYQELRNTSFDLFIMPTLSQWTCRGDVRAIKRLGDIYPTESVGMSMITTGIGSGESAYLSGNGESSISQTFPVPTNDMTTFSFDYNFVSEEPMEYVGSVFNDNFVAYVIVNNNGVLEQIEVTRNSINTAEWIKLNGVDFTDGDSTCYKTGWINVQIDVSGYDNITGVAFAVSDVGDSIFDTAVLIDNVELYS